MVEPSPLLSEPMALSQLIRRFRRDAPKPTTRAQQVAAEDQVESSIGVRRFSLGTRPVIRWIKGDGLDDGVTRAAIGQATRLFGSSVDYCLCTQGITAERAREVLSWAAQPVEWWPISGSDNPELERLLLAAGCPPERFGYWWKWFPERVRADAPEWILDGDMVIVGKPSWFDDWASGSDRVRVSQDDRPAERHGRYSSFVDKKLMLYSGLISLPPGVRYMKNIADVLQKQSLEVPHDGCVDMCEQGVIAAAFQHHCPAPIPLHEFPFGRAFEAELDFGLSGDQGRAWGYHFGNAFRMPNPHFESLSSSHVVFKADEVTIEQRFTWLGGQGPWGIPGWTMPPWSSEILAEKAREFAGKDVLELGTSRGRATAIVSSLGCRVTTVDHQDRGARFNLQGLGVEVVVSDAVDYLKREPRKFDLIIVDLHGNSPEEWKLRARPLLSRLRSGGTFLIHNVHLHQVPSWEAESGVEWFLSRLPKGWSVELLTETLPGWAVVKKP